MLSTDIIINILWKCLQYTNKETSISVRLDITKPENEERYENTAENLHVWTVLELLNGSEFLKVNVKEIFLERVVGEGYSWYIL